jgi:hypothetical protein
VALYLPDQNALFLNIPQTHGHLVASALRTTLGLTTVSVGDNHAHKDLVGTLRLEHDPYTFAFVRNPLDWYPAFWRAKMRSEAQWSTAASGALWHPAWAFDPGVGDEEFPRFIEKVCERGGFLHETYRLYTGRGTGDEIHYIGKTESLLDDLCTVLNTIGVDYRRSELAALEGLSTRRRKLYTPALTAMVAAAEHATFVDYGYDLPRPSAKERAANPQTIDDIPGWFPAVDKDLFQTLLAWQVANEAPGNLVELGAYLGKSAVVMGEAQQPGEVFTVCDLWGAEADHADNSAENDVYYSTLDREQFERNYLRFRPALPEVVQRPSAAILDYVKPGSARFVHVDASHLYEHVAVDVVSARTMLRPGGIVVFDDYCSQHTPGVAAAVWGAMLNAGLKPIALTRKKWYGTWDDPAVARKIVQDWIDNHERYGIEYQEIAGQEVYRIVSKARAALAQKAHSPGDQAAS